MKILSTFLLAGVITTATPITVPPITENTPPWLCELPQSHSHAWDPSDLQISSSSGDIGRHEFLRSDAAPVPEPDTFLLLASGLFLVAGLARKKARREQSTTRAA